MAANATSVPVADGNEPDANCTNCLLANLACLIFGLIVTQTLQAAQFRIRSRFAHGKASFVAVSRLFAVAWGFADIYLWKSVWDGINCLFGKTFLTSISTLLIGIVGLLAGGALKSVASVPIGIVLDEKANMSTAHLYFKSTVR